MCIPHIADQCGLNSQWLTKRVVLLEESPNGKVLDVAWMRPDAATLDISTRENHSATYRDKGSSNKSCSKGILELSRLPGIKKIFAMEY